MNFLKKLNKVYTAVFGNDNDCYPMSVGDSNQPLQSAVRGLQYQVKQQAKTIEALAAHLKLDITHDYTELTDERKVVLKKTK